MIIVKLVQEQNTITHQACSPGGSLQKGMRHCDGKRSGSSLGHRPSGESRAQNLPKGLPQESLNLLSAS